jgi:hypothetical protein
LIYERRQSRGEKWPLFSFRTKAGSFHLKEVPPMRSPCREAARSVGLLLAMLTGLLLARWGLAGGLSRPLILATPASPPAAEAPVTPGMPELRGRLLYLGGDQLLVADAGGGPLRSLRMRVAGRTSVLRQGRYLVVRVAEQLQEGPVFSVATSGPGTVTPLGNALEVLPSPRPDRVWLLGRRARSPQQTFTLQEVELATGRRLASLALPHDAEPVAMVDGGVLVRDLRAGLAVRDPAERERQRLGTDLTLVDATASLVAYVDDRGDLRLRNLATRRDRAVRPIGMPGWFPLERPVAGAGCCDPFGCQPCLGWSIDGWLFFFSGGPPPDLVTAWQPGRPTARPLDLPLDGAIATVPGSLAV